jgi:hypothetical protein
MAKSRNRSRDARKRAKKKRMNRERITRRETEMVKCPLCDAPTSGLVIRNNGCCLACDFRISD